jgi:hypothetical protein
MNAEFTDWKPTIPPGRKMREPCAATPIAFGGAAAPAGATGPGAGLDVSFALEG